MKKVLIVGIGNPIRQDDDLGPHCIRQLEEKLSVNNKELVDLMIVHQLDVLHCNVFAEYQMVIFIDADARLENNSVIVEEISPEPQQKQFTSHIGSIADIMALTGNMFGITPKTYLIAIKGASFEIGEGLSPVALDNAETALQKINYLINEFFPFA
jgi:hydrogenase maturation protease